MNTDEIIRMAREAGFDDYEQDNMLIRFANLVAAAEREECATDLEAIAVKAKEINPEGFVCKTIKNCAAAIRAKGNT